MQKALITGASSGIGYELARIMAARGHDLILVSRDKSKLAGVRSEIKAEYGVDVVTIVQDLSESGAAKSYTKKPKIYRLRFWLIMQGLVSWAIFLKRT